VLRLSCFGGNEGRCCFAVGIVNVALWGSVILGGLWSLVVDVFFFDLVPLVLTPLEVANRDFVMFLVKAFCSRFFIGSIDLELSPLKNVHTGDAQRTRAFFFVLDLYIVGAEICFLVVGGVGYSALFGVDCAVGNVDGTIFFILGVESLLRIDANFNNASRVELGIKAGATFVLWSKSCTMSFADRRK
jgi:hypothetical protein